MRKFLSLILVLCLFSVGFATRAQALTCEEAKTIGGLLNVPADRMTALYGLVSGGCSTSIDFCHTFNQDLKSGDVGAEVSNLYLALIYNQYGGHSQDFWDRFTPDIVSRVQQLQAKYGIPQTGYVGSLTRAKLNELYGCSAVSKSLPSIKITSPNGGENWTMGSKQTVRFETSGLPTGAMVVISQFGISISDDAIKAGEYQFVLPSYQSNGGDILHPLLAGPYKLTLAVYDHKGCIGFCGPDPLGTPKLLASDSSDNYFTISK